MQLNGVSNLIRMETRNSGNENIQEISIRELIRTALRMRPDRIIVGECRGAETFDMLQNLNTGHDGSLTTIHANSAKDCIQRLEMMVRMGVDLPLDAIQSQIATGINLIIYLERMSDRSRKVQEIVEVVGIVDGEVKVNPLYARVDKEMIRVGELKNTVKMEKWDERMVFEDSD